MFCNRLDQNPIINNSKIIKTYKKQIILLKNISINAQYCIKDIKYYLKMIDILRKQFKPKFYITIFLFFNLRFV